MTTHEDMHIFKLVSGEEVIGELAHIDGTGDYVVKEPRVFYVSRDPAGNPVFDLGPIVYSTLAFEQIVINRDSVICTIKGVAEPVHKAYLRATGQVVLDVVENKIITP